MAAAGDLAHTPPPRSDLEKPGVARRWQCAGLGTADDPVAAHAGLWPQLRPPGTAFGGRCASPNHLSDHLGPGHRRHRRPALAYPLASARPACTAAGHAQLLLGAHHPTGLGGCLPGTHPELAPLRHHRAPHPAPRPLAAAAPAPLMLFVRYV